MYHLHAHICTRHVDISRGQITSTDHAYTLLHVQSAHTLYIQYRTYIHTIQRAKYNIHPLLTHTRAHTDTHTRTRVPHAGMAKVLIWSNEHLHHASRQKPADSAEQTTICPKGDKLHYVIRTLCYNWGHLAIVPMTCQSELGR